jgi:hypothetical protein
MDRLHLAHEHRRVHKARDQYPLVRAWWLRVLLRSWTIRGLGFVEVS